MAETNSKTPIVFIPGIKGSSLVGPDGKIVWVNMAHAIALQTPNLRLPLNWETGVQEHDEIVAHAAMNGWQGYGLWLRRMSKIARPFHPFPYDWRRDNNETQHLGNLAS
jgi:hypothetical protein